MRGAASILLLSSVGLLQAQQDLFRSKLSVQGGMVRSLGDITSGLETFDPERTAMLGMSYERFLTYGVSLYGGYEYLRLSGNDRETGSRARSLNFLAEVNTVQIGLRLYADNGRLLNYDARFAPFVQVGFGAGVYDVYGDLYDGTGARYNYWIDGTIRTLPEDAPDAASARIMEQDGEYGTRLTDLATEQGKPRDAWFMFVPARLGVKWRISDRFSAEVSYAFNWTFTDHLDDVSGDYPPSFASGELAYISNPAGHAGPRGNNGSDDHYHHLGLGLSVALGRRSHKFRMPPVRAKAPVAWIPAVRPDTIAAPTPVIVPSDTTTRHVIIDVQSIRVARLEVDTVIMRASRAADTTMVRGDTLGKGSMTRSADPLNLQRAVLDTVGIRGDTLLKGSMTRSRDPLKLQRAVPDTLGVREDRLGKGTSEGPMDPLRPQPAMRDTVNVREDTLGRGILEGSTDTLKLQRAVPDTMGVRNGLGKSTSDQATDSVKGKQVQPDTVRVREGARDNTRSLQSGDTIKGSRSQPDTAAVREGVLDKSRMNEEHEPIPEQRATPVPVKEIPDTLDQGSVPGDTPALPRSTKTAPAPHVVSTDTLSTPRQRPRDTADPAPKNTTGTGTAPAPTAEHHTTERIIERTAPPVVVIQKEVVRDTVVKEVMVVVRDTVPMRADTTMITPKDSVVEGEPRSALPAPAAPARSQPGPEVRSALEMQRDHAVRMNRILNDRIRTLERYLAMHENSTGATEVDSLRQRIAQLDDELEMVRRDAVPTVMDPAPPMPMAIMDSVRFASDSFQVSRSYQQKLATTAKRIIDQDAPKVLVTGHTDRSGDAGYNLALSQRRAESVADALREAGVPADRIRVKGLGQKLARQRYDRNERVVVVQVERAE